MAKRKLQGTSEEEGGRLNCDEGGEEIKNEKIPKMTFTCKRCAATMKVFSKEDMRRHYIEAHNDKPVDCDVCQKLFPSLKQMRDHKRAKHSYPCQFCARICAKPKDLEQHIKSAHGGDNKFKCELCPQFAFDTENNLQKHVKEHEANEMLRKCPVCKYVATGEIDLAEHGKVHVQQTCKDCGESFPTGGAYYKHRKRTGHDRWMNKNPKVQAYNELKKKKSSKK